MIKLFCVVVCQWIWNKWSVIWYFRGKCSIFFVYCQYTGLICWFMRFLRVFLFFLKLPFWFIFNLLFKRHIIFLSFLRWYLSLFIDLFGIFAYQSIAIIQVFSFLIIARSRFSFGWFDIDENTWVVAEWFLNWIQQRFWCLFNLKILQIVSFNFLIFFILDRYLSIFI